MAAPQNKNYSAPAQQAPKAEEIPIIEENASPGNFVSEEMPAQDGEIDVKDIPF